MSSTITRDSLSSDSGTPAAPNGDGTLFDDDFLQNMVYARVDELFSGAGAHAKLVLGGALQVDGQPRFSAYHSAVQSILNAAPTIVLLDSEDYDVGGMHSIVSQTSRGVVPSGQDGTYHYSGQVSFAPNAAGYRYIEVLKNGTTVIAYTTGVDSPSASVTSLPISGDVVLAAGDYLELRATQASGGALNIGHALRGYTNVLQMRRVL